MYEVLPSLGFQLGAGAIGGFIAGYALKKISKLVAIIIGLFLIALIYLGTQNIISINYNALFDAVASLFGSASSAFSMFIGIISLLPFAGTFIVGLLLGFKMG